jgi:pyrophosphatase PpaX
VKLKTILFDIDGTLLDTEPFILKAYAAAYAGLKKTNLPSGEELMRLTGGALEGVYELLVGEDWPEAVRLHRAFQLKNMHLSVAFPGAKETLAFVKSRGYRLGAVTNRSKATSAKTLELGGLSEHIEVVVAAEDSVALKPDPAPLYRALDLLGESSSGDGVVFVGDTAVDVFAGRAIGATTVAATYGFHRRGVLETNPDYQIDDISELPNLLKKIDQ